MAKSQAIAFTLGLRGKLTVRGIEAIRGQLQAALAEHETVAVDCAEAEAVDLSFIQLLLAGHRSAGGRLCLAGTPPPPLLDALRRGGFLEGAGPAHPLWQSVAGAV